MQRNKIDYIKHLVECHCVHPAFKDKNVFHKFIVFSKIINDAVAPKYAQCNNCGVIHRVYDITKSEIIMGDDENVSLLSIEDIKFSINDKLVSFLEKHELDISTWEEVRFIIENKLYDKKIVLTKEKKGDVFVGKYITINSPTTFQINSYTYSDLIS